MDKKYKEIDFTSLIGCLLVQSGKPEKSDKKLSKDEVIRKLDVDIPKHIRHLCLLRRSVLNVMTQGHNYLIINQKFIIKGLKPDHVKGLTLMISRALGELVVQFLFENKIKIDNDAEGNFRFTYDENWQVYLMKPQPYKANVDEIYQDCMNRMRNPPD